MMLIILFGKACLAPLSCTTFPQTRFRMSPLLTEFPEGGWGVAGHANTGGDLAEAARAEMAAG
jgi:hypothetical protein